MSDDIVDPEQSKESRSGKRRKPRRGRRVNEKKVVVAAEPAAETAETKTPEAKAPTVKTPWHEHRVAIIAITALFTLLGGIGLALFNSSRAPKTLSATIGKLTVETHVPLRDFLKHTDDAASEFPDEALQAQVGYVVHAQVQLVGFKGHTCNLRWEAYDNESRARIDFPDWCDNQTPIELRAEAESDMASPRFWVPPPPSNKPFFVRVMIDDGKQTPLKNTTITFADTEAIKPPPLAPRAPKPTLSPAGTPVPCPPSE